jgi:hypothetical protein
LGETLVLSDVLGGGEGDGEGKLDLLAEGGLAAEKTVDGLAEGVVFGLWGGAGVDEEGGVVTGEEVSEGRFPMDGKVLPEDQGVGVVGDGLDARVAVGGGANGAMNPLKPDGAGGEISGAEGERGGGKEGASGKAHGASCGVGISSAGSDGAGRGARLDFNTGASGTRRIVADSLGG